MSLQSLPRTGLLSGVTAKLPWPRLKVRASSEKHRGIRVIDAALIVSWPRAPRPVTTPEAKGWELAFYVTMRT
jgi:hypothetical protein